MHFLFVSKTQANSLLTHCAVWQLAAHSASTLCAEREPACGDIRPLPRQGHSWKCLQGHHWPLCPSPIHQFSLFCILLTLWDSSLLIVSFEMEAITENYLLLSVSVPIHLISKCSIFGSAFKLLYAFHILESGMSVFTLDVKSEKWLLLKMTMFWEVFFSDFMPESFFVLIVFSLVMEWQKTIHSRPYMIVMDISIQL